MGEARETREYRVGQVIYVILRKETRVYPMQVTERISKTTMEGDTVTYMVRGGTGVGETMRIEDIDGEVFDTSNGARQSLLGRVTAQINGIIDNAVNKAKEWYPNGFEQASDDPLASVRKQPGAPVTSAPVRQPRRQRAETAALAAELAAEAGNVVELEDGTLARVKMPAELQG